MGTPEFAVPTLHALVESGYPILRVVTQPDRPQGRGRRLISGPVKQYSLDQGLEVLQPVKIADPVFVELLRVLEPDVIVVVAFGRILPPEILKVPCLGCVNVHASLLPRYRGAAPIHWAVINGEQETGITTMLMDEGLDTGDILLQKKLLIEPDDSVGVVHDRLARLGTTLLVETLDRLAEGELKARPQDEVRATYAPPIRREHELIAWARPALEIKNQVRGLDPWPGAYTLLGGRELKVWRVEVVSPDKVMPSDGGDRRSGRLLLADPERGLVVRAGMGALRIHELQLAGRKRVRAENFLRGYPLAAGTVLGE
jgi:methionyl-tRNA formyltransferase